MVSSTLPLISAFQFALPRGERRGVSNGVSEMLTFQFALPRGERRRFIGFSGFWVAFQFALPRGERRARWPPSSEQVCFNSRSRVGSDAVCDSQCTGNDVSIRAPAWGATEAAAPASPAMTVSIRAPAWGATHGFQQAVRPSGVSIRAPAWGATCER